MEWIRRGDEGRDWDTLFHSSSLHGGKLLESSFKVASKSVWITLCLRMSLVELMVWLDSEGSVASGPRHG